METRWGPISDRMKVLGMIGSRVVVVSEYELSRWVDMGWLGMRLCQEVRVRYCVGGVRDHG